MTDRLDLPDRWRRQIEALLAEHVPEAEVWAYGSRVTGRNHEASDLDLVLRGPNLEPVPTGQLADLCEALEESNIPIIVDVHDWARVPGSFKPEIERQYVALQSTTRLRNLVDLVTETWIPAPESQPHIFYIQTGDLKNNRLLNRTRLVVGVDKIPSRARRKVHSGDILYALVRPNQQHHGILHHAPENTVASTGFAVLRAKNDLADPDYIYWWLTQDHIVEQLQALAEHSTSAYPSIVPENLLDLPISVPSFESQQRTARVLRALDDRIELNRRMSDTLEAMAQALFKSWFVDFDPVRAKMEDRPSGLQPELDSLFPAAFEESELGEIPTGWMARPLEEVIDVNPRRNIRRGEVATHVEMAAVPIRGPQVRAWTYREYASGSRFNGGDTLFGRITPSLENGKVALVDFLDHDEVGWGSTEFIVLRPRPPWPPEYAYIMAREARFRNHAIVNMTGTSGRQRVPADVISAYRMPIPDNDVVVAFGQVVQPWFESTTNLGRQSDCLAEQRDALLPWLFSGKLRTA